MRKIYFKECDKESYNKCVDCEGLETCCLGIIEHFKDDIYFGFVNKEEDELYWIGKKSEAYINKDCVIPDPKFEEHKQRMISGS